MERPGSRTQIPTMFPADVSPLGYQPLPVLEIREIRVWAAASTVDRW